MTNEQINLAIAEACGWRREDGVYMWTANGIDCTCPVLWDWVNDLNAMHEAEKLLFADDIADDAEEDLESQYQLRLKLATGELAWDRVGKVYRATARQRAEAFLRTLGKWDQSGDVTEMVKEVQK